MKNRIRKLYQELKGSLFYPVTFWDRRINNYVHFKETILGYVSPVALFCSVLIFICHTCCNGLSIGIRMAVVNYVSSVGGIILSYLLIREYMCNKLNTKRSYAASLTIYSGTIYISLHSLGIAFEFITIGQLFTLASLIFIRTLYIGINKIDNITTAQKKNLLIIVLLTIICFTALANRLLRFILFV